MRFSGSRSVLSSDIDSDLTSYQFTDFLVLQKFFGVSEQANVNPATKVHVGPDHSNQTRATSTAARTMRKGW